MCFCFVSGGDSLTGGRESSVKVESELYRHRVRVSNSTRVDVGERELQGSNRSQKGGIERERESWIEVSSMLVFVLERSNR